MTEPSDNAKYLAECQRGLRKPPPRFPDTHSEDCLADYDSLRGLSRICAVDTEGHPTFLPAESSEQLRWIPCL